ncbi:MAG: AraC family transcriptional regulator, partial [Acidimicrobiaceae bacterium]|nr:AraC family transcriptional regulator [Acidimicrobiaceae bacterium]
RTFFGRPPTPLRGGRRPEGRRPPVGMSAGSGGGPARSPGARGEISLRLPYREPFYGPGILAFLGQRAVAGVEEWDGCEYRRTLSLPHGAATVALAEGPGHVRCRLTMTDLRDLGTAVARARRLLDLDADPVAVGEHLGADPLLAPLVAAIAGRRIPGAVDGAEIALRAVLGQQVSVAAARQMASTLTEAWGEDLPGGPSPTPADGRPAGPNRLFPAPAVIAELDPARLAMPLARGKALVALADALAEGRIVIDPGADRQDVPRQLRALAGIGPWTAAYVALRGLGDPDAFLPGDLGVRRGLAALGQASSPADAARIGERWRPWRGYALQYLWAAG